MWCRPSIQGEPSHSWLPLRLSPGSLHPRRPTHLCRAPGGIRQPASCRRLQGTVQVPPLCPLMCGTVQVSPRRKTAHTCSTVTSPREENPRQRHSWPNIGSLPGIWKEGQQRKVCGLFIFTWLLWSADGGSPTNLCFVPRQLQD